MNGMIFDLQRFASKSINGTEGNDDINNSIGNSMILAYGGNDTIINISNYVTVSGGDGSDKIYNSKGRNTSINGGAGNDYIENGLVYGSTLGANSTVEGGKGNDSIVNIDAQNVVFKYTSGDGNDSISGFNATRRCQSAAALTQAKSVARI